MLAQLVYACLCACCALLALEAEGTGHDTHSEGAVLLGCLCHNGSSTGSGSAAHASGHKDHVCLGYGFLDKLNAFRGSLAAHFRIGTCAKAPGELFPKLNVHGCGVGIECLQVRVGADELNTGQPKLNHVLDGIAAATADTHDQYACAACHMPVVNEIHYGVLHGLFLSIFEIPA